MKKYEILYLYSFNLTKVIICSDKVVAAHNFVPGFIVGLVAAPPRQEMPFFVNRRPHPRLVYHITWPFNANREPYGLELIDPTQMLYLKLI